MSALLLKKCRLNGCLQFSMYQRPSPRKNVSASSRSQRFFSSRSPGSSIVPSVRIADILDQRKDALEGSFVRVCGWIRTVRYQKTHIFIELNDGSSVDGVQLVLDSDQAKKLSLATGASVTAAGHLRPSPSGKTLELVHPDVQILGECGSDYPLQKKRHSMEYLREVAHLRARSNTFGAMLRIRNSLTMAVHDYFQRHHFIHIHTPIINSNDCEGTGETFLLNVRQKDQKTHDPIDDLSNSKASLATLHDLSNSHFFGVDECYLTVSGQLEAEIFASALSKVYTFGPAFRAENSHTSRHLSEFWMVEPEMSFVNLQELMETAEASIKSCIEYVLTHSSPDLNFFNSRIDQTLMTRLHQNRKDDYIRMSYSEAVKILQEKSGLGINWGQDLSREHERWICDCYTQKPVFITHYPKTLKPFYMRLADSKRAGSDAETVECFDLLVPKIGELVGGSSREERYDALKLRMGEMGLDVERLNWYLELRKFGTTPHAGFGIGFERLLMYITGLENIRDVIPIPRYPRYCKF